MCRSYLYLSEHGNFQIKYLPAQGEKKVKPHSHSSFPASFALGMCVRYPGVSANYKKKKKKKVLVKTALPKVLVHLKICGCTKFDRIKVT